MACIVALLVMIYTQAALLEERALSKTFCTYHDYTCYTGDSPSLRPSAALSKQITHCLACSAYAKECSAAETSLDVAMHLVGQD